MSHICANHIQDSCDVSNVFETLNKILQFEHVSLVRDPNPIKTIMELNDGYYFLPVFYTLCQHFGKDFKCVVDHLHSFLDAKFYSLLAKLRILNPVVIECVTRDMTLDTLNFCVDIQQSTTHDNDKLKSIVNNYQQLVLSVTTSDQMVNLVWDILKRHTPIRLLQNSFKKPSKCIWNIVTGSWQPMKNDHEITNNVSNIWNSVKQLYIKYYELSDGTEDANEEPFQTFKVSKVVSKILPSLQRDEPKKLDEHKWFLGLPDGVLDLLTGHVGGSVPEFILTDRKLTLDIPRADLNRLCNKAPHLEFIYGTLTKKNVFSLFVSILKEKDTVDVIDTLQAFVPYNNNNNIDDLELSMLHFYANLCKWTSFDYDLFMYLLDVLASVYVGTNYEQKLIVFKGCSSNGKTTLLNLMERVLGGYFQRIDPLHRLTPKSTLFSCRLGVTEELENKKLRYIMDNTFGDVQYTGTIPFTKFFVTTNTYHKIQNNMKDHVVVVPFKSEFVNDASTYTSDQITKSKFPKDVSVIDQSFKGCFLMLYYHLKKNMNSDDGLLHYRAMPDCVIKETHEFLMNVC